jgi:hypothetical protein
VSSNCRGNLVGSSRMSVRDPKAAQPGLLLIQRPMLGVRTVRYNQLLQIDYCSHTHEVSFTPQGIRRPQFYNGLEYQRRFTRCTWVVVVRKFQLVNHTTYSHHL